MGYWHPKNKFEWYFNVIGELLYIGALIGAFIFIIGYGFYKIFRWKWFYEKPIIAFLIAWLIGISILIFIYYPFKKKKKL